MSNHKPVLTIGQSFNLPSDTQTGGRIAFAIKDDHGICVRVYDKRVEMKSVVLFVSVREPEFSDYKEVLS